MQYCIDKYNYNQIKKIIMAKIYVASSWRNVFQQDVVGILRDLGHEVYDFKNPPHGNGGFQWSDIDPNWQNWTTEQYREALNQYAYFLSTR